MSPQAVNLLPYVAGSHRSDGSGYCGGRAVKLYALILASSSSTTSGMTEAKLHVSVGSSSISNKHTPVVRFSRVKVHGWHFMVEDDAVGGELLRKADLDADCGSIRWEPDPGLEGEEGGE